MNLIKLYFDEDAMHYRLVTALRSGLMEKTGEEQLTFATGQECVLYTFDVSDFYRIHKEWISTGRGHAGMILAPQQRFSVGEQLRRIVRLRATESSSSMRNRVEFLSNWG